MSRSIVPFARRVAWVAAVAALAGSATAADIEITTPVGGGFSIRNSTATLLMQIQSGGALAIPGLPSAS